MNIVSDNSKVQMETNNIQNNTILNHQKPLDRAQQFKSNKIITSKPT